MRALFALSCFSILAACSGSPTKNAAAPSPETSTSAASTTSAPPSVEHVSKVEVPSAIAAVVAANDRSDDDKKLDEGRKPGATLAFFGIAPGEHVAELMATRGYTTELLARAVAPNGVVYGQNNKFILEKFAEKGWGERLSKPVNKGIVRVDRELDDPLPPEAKELDAVLMVLFYHDTVWLGTDRAKMNAAIFHALKKGGVYGIVDHAGREGTGTTEAQTLHRIEEKIVVDEITKAGFVLQAEADFLRNPADTKDWNASPMKAGDKRGTSDRFVLRFIRP